MDVETLVTKHGRRRGLSETTIATYNNCLKKFFRKYKIPPHQLKKADIEHFIDQSLEKNLASSTINVYIHALKFFYEKVLRKRLTINIPKIRIKKRLPTVLTKSETRLLLQTIKNPKHKLMISLLYSSGMRVSELVKVKVQDFEFSNNFGWVRQGKGGKDRPFIIAKNLRKPLIRHISQNKLQNNDYLFPSRSAHISASTVRLILQEARARAGITKNVHPHTLRHSFATHLVENKEPIQNVQPLLGHKNIQTTLVYVHTARANVIDTKSPYDSLEKGQS